MSDNNFVFLISPEIEDTDFIVNEMVRGNINIVFYKLLYVLPYNTFNGIKNFQIATKYHPFEGTSDISMIVSVDLSEWIGHESEDYIKIFFKFLADFEPE